MLLHDLWRQSFVLESDSALSRRSSQMSGSNSTTVDYKLRHAATVANITRDTGGNSAVHAAHSLPSRMFLVFAIYKISPMLEKVRISGMKNSGFPHFLENLEK